MRDFTKQIDSVIDYIIDNDNFLISSHINPDGDNIGSSLAMYRFLKKLNKKVVYVMNDPYPENLMFLYDSEVKKRSSDLEEKIGYNVIALDSGDYKRICVDKEILEGAKEIICIDHHITNGDYAAIKYIDEEESSTCESVYNVIRRYEDRTGNEIIDKDISTYLYTGLVTDTGNFMYSNTKPSSYIMAVHLINKGARKSEVIENIYQSNKVNFYKILGEALNNIEIINSKIAIITVTKEMMDKYGVEYDDIDAITPYTRDIKGVELGIFIKEKNTSEIKVSLRSKEYVDCAELASQFGGGGHKRAAGVSFRDFYVGDVKRKLVANAEKYL